MKLLLTCVLAAILTHPLAAETVRNYELTINGEKRDIALGTEYVHRTSSGEVVKIRIDKKDVVVYEGSFVTFRHRADLNAATKALSKSTRQILIATAEGSLVLVQEYEATDPSTLIETMVRQLTKEDVAYGHEMKTEPFTKTLKTGLTLSGTKATLRYRGEEATYTVCAYGKRDQGVLVVTRLDKSKSPEGLQLIDLFWDSLSVQLH